MTDKQKRAGLERLLRKCPDVLTPVGAARWTHQSKNTIYELIKENALPAYNYRGGFLIAKPKYGAIFAELRKGVDKPSDIARNTGLKANRTCEDVPKVMKLAQTMLIEVMTEYNIKL